MKITIIGGGSSTFVPQLMRLLLESAVLAESTVTLMDIDTDRLEVMHQLCDLLIKREGSKLSIESTTDQRAALTGADFVVAAISVGGMDAWERDIEIPARYGIYMTIADSIGPGGIMRALRHIPVLAKVVEDLTEVAPDAWLFNYSNPLSAIITALRRHRPAIRSTGLCTCSSIARRPAYLAEWTSVEPDQIALPAPAAGINHCAFMLDARRIDGTSLLPLIAQRAKQEVIRWGIETYGVIPYCWSHVTEFFPAMSQLEEPYNGKLQGLQMAYGLHVHDMEHERSRMKHWQALVDQWTRGREGEASLNVLPKAEAIEVIQIIEALLINGSALHGVNTLNQGAIPNLPSDAVVEVTSLVNAYGIQPVRMRPLPEGLAATLRAHITTQQLTAEAALTGDYRTALQAFIQDPQTQARLALPQIKELLDEMLAAHRAHLPQFE